MFQVPPVWRKDLAEQVPVAVDVPDADSDRLGGRPGRQCIQIPLIALALDIWRPMLHDRRQEQGRETT